jgi:NAD(P)-dependent dehydrogenase (short-subunit alcohol dehydrogenase family)
MAAGVSGKVVLVAGGTGGLGQAVSLAFLEAGATVIATYQVKAEADALKSRGAGARLELHDVDVTDEAAVQRLVSGVIGRHERIDALVNAVGGYAGGPRLWEHRPDIFEHMVSLNLRSGYALTRIIAPLMVDAGRGAIVSVAAKAGLMPFAGAAAYAASKAAAIALMEALAAEVKGSGVRVNSILPSIIDTASNRAAMPTADFAAWPKPDDIARVILFLCSDDARVIHGAAIPVYGDS